MLEEVADHHGLARAWRLLTYVHMTATRWGVAAEAAEQTIRHATQAGDEVMARRSLGMLAPCVLYGPTPVGEAIARCEEVLSRAADDRRASAITEVALAHLEAMRGNFGTARVRYRRSRALLEEFGYRFFAALTSLDSSLVEMLADDLQAAERELRKDYDTLEQMGERNYLSTTAGILAEVLYRQGRYEESAELARVCRELASPGDVTSQFLWRCVQAKLLARRAPARAVRRDHRRGDRTDRRFRLDRLAGQRIHGSRRGVPARRPYRRRPRGAGAGGEAICREGQHRLCAPGGRARRRPAGGPGSHRPGSAPAGRSRLCRVTRRHGRSSTIPSNAAMTGTPARRTRPPPGRSPQERPGLEKVIRAWINTWNQEPRPCTWMKTADEILERLASYLNRNPSGRGRRPGPLGPEHRAVGGSAGVDGRVVNDERGLQRGVPASAVRRRQHRRTTRPG